MIPGQEKIGAIGMDLLDKVEENYPPERNPIIHQVITVCEVEFTDDEGDRSTQIVYDYSQDRPVERAGLYVYLGQAMGID